MLEQLKQIRDQLIAEAGKDYTPPSLEKQFEVAQRNLNKPVLSHLRDIKAMLEEMNG